VKGNISNSASSTENPLKVQIEYTNAKGERLTVDKEVKLELSSGNMTASGMSGGQKSSGFSSYLPYIVIIVIAGGAYVYRGKIKEMIQARKERKSGIPRPEEKKD
jgi:flagellar basal body L-ring protein FlgH